MRESEELRSELYTNASLISDVPKITPTILGEVRTELAEIENQLLGGKTYFYLKWQQYVAKLEMDCQRGVVIRSIKKATIT